MKRIGLLACIVLFSHAEDIEAIKKSMLLNYMEGVTTQKLTQQENEEIVRQNARYYGDIVKSAREYYSGFIGKIWGDENVKLSGKKRFTQYSDDMNARESVDFEKGTVTIEMVADENEDVSPEVLQQRLDALKSESKSQAIGKDPVAALSQKYMRKKGLIGDAPPADGGEKFVEGLVGKGRVEKGQIEEKRITTGDGKAKKIVSVTIPMVPNRLEVLATRYRGTVEAYAQENRVPPSYIFGTIQTESYFNPLAVSHVPAYGLMQIVPTTAGVDAYEALYGKKRIVSPDFLYDEQNNIMMGSKYIQIIREQYLMGIENEESLTYCTATAYNAGIGSLIRSFTGNKSDRSAAIAKINSMTPGQVYEHLRTSPALTEEARNYVQKMRNHRDNFRQWDARQE